MTDTKKAAPNGTAQSNHSTDYNTHRFPSLALADAEKSLPPEYRPNGVHRALAECICAVIDGRGPYSEGLMRRTTVQERAQISSGYTLSKIRNCIDLLISA